MAGDNLGDTNASSSDAERISHDVSGVEILAASKRPEKLAAVKRHFVVGDYVGELASGQSTVVPVRFHPISEGNYAEKVNVVWSRDPLLVEFTVQVPERWWIHPFSGCRCRI